MAVATSHKDDGLLLVASLSLGTLHLRCPCLFPTRLPTGAWLPRLLLVNGPSNIYGDIQANKGASRLRALGRGFFCKTLQDYLSPIFRIFPDGAPPPTLRGWMKFRTPPEASKTKHTPVLRYSPGSKFNSFFSTRGKTGFWLPVMKDW